MDVLFGITFVQDLGTPMDVFFRCFRITLVQDLGTPVNVLFGGRWITSSDDVCYKPSVKPENVLN